MKKLVLGTRNAKKADELVELLSSLRLAVMTLVDFPDAPAVDEDGASFAENAQKKACELAKALGQWVLGEDSGLVVPALGHRPGIYSARYAGAHATDESNNQKLLEEMREFSGDQRAAYYVCSLAVCDPSGGLRAQAEGRCHGRITREPRGSGGFGYDPLFEITEYHKTFGELGRGVKRHLSHRARAVVQLLPQLVVLRHAEQPAAQA